MSSRNSAPLDPDLKTRVEQELGLPLSNGYGITECSPGISGVPFDAPRPDHTVAAYTFGNWPTQGEPERPFPPLLELEIEQGGLVRERVGGGGVRLLAGVHRCQLDVQLVEQKDSATKRAKRRSAPWTPQTRSDLARIHRNLLQSWIRSQEIPVRANTNILKEVLALAKRT